MSTFAAGSLTQLVAKGALDMYLSTNPEATFWKSGFSRCTAFSMEAIIQDFNGNSGQQSTLELNRTGDLLYTQYLMLHVPAIQYDCGTGGFDEREVMDNKGERVKCCEDDSAQTNLSISHESDSCLETAAYAHWTNAIGQYLIDKLDILIGSQHVDTLYGDFLFVHEELCGKVGRRLLEMVGKRYTREELIVDSQEDRTLYVPLPFWYTLSSGSSLPLAGLQFHSVRYQLHLQDASRAIHVHHRREGSKEFVPQSGGNYWKLCGSTSRDVSFKPQMLSTYVYLDDAERKMFSQTNTESLIVQHQRLTFQNISTPMNLVFNHPVIELIWFTRSDANTSARNHFNLAGPYGRDPLKGCQLRMNNQLRFGSDSNAGSENATYFRLVQPYQAHSCIPDTFVYCYSFALHPEDTTTPSGSANFSRIDNITLSLTHADDIDPTGYHVTVFAVNWNVARMKNGLFGVAYSS
jgi:hypothetical protein